MKEYKTVEFENADEFVERKSRFIGYVKPVKNSEQAEEFISAVKAKNRNAAHNVYAYVIRENNIQHCSDNGEPSGTAGVPVLEVLLKNQLVDVCVVVTSYFGGILLGTGGLARAYSHAASLAVNSGGIIRMALSKILNIDIPYSFYGAISDLLKEFSANIYKSDFSDKVSISFTVSEQKVSELIVKITELTNGSCRLTETGEIYDKV